MAEAVRVILAQQPDGAVQVSPMHAQCAAWGGWELVNVIPDPPSHWECDHCNRPLVAERQTTDNSYKS